MQISVVEGLPVEADDIAQRSRDTSFYHTRPWIESLGYAYPSMKARTVIGRDGSRAVGFLPFFEIKRGATSRLWSLPFGTYGGPATTEGSTVQRALVDAFLALRAGGGVQEIGLIDYAGELTSAKMESAVHTTHVLDLSPGFDTVWGKCFDKTKRRQTRKAEREGIVVREAASLDEVKAYYQIYLERSLMWRQPNRYPETLFERLYQSGRDSVRLFVALADDKLLGGHLNFYYRDAVIAWNGVTTEGSRGVQASTLLYSRCIEDACKNGYRSYNLGGSLGKSSLVAYKESLGGASHEYRILRWRSFGGKVTSAMRKLLRR